MIKKNLTAILNYYKLPAGAQLKRALTHKQHNEKNNNSQYVFLGMYAFKGVVAKCLYQYTKAEGTQLQHCLGNIFSTRYLATLFDQWGLANECYIPTSIINQQKHIMVYGILGYLYASLEAPQLEHFAKKFFIEPHSSILPSNIKVINSWSLLCASAKNIQLPHIHRKHSITEQQEHCWQIFAGEQLIGEHTSKSITYAKKKSIKIALTYVLAASEEKYINTESYQALKTLLTSKQEAERQQIKLQKQIAYEEKVTLKKLEKQQKKIKQALQRAEEQKKRIMNKKEQKAKVKTTKTIYRVYTDEEIAAMSNSKRRNLEDRGIIPKRK